MKKFMKYMLIIIIMCGSKNGFCELYKETELWNTLKKFEKYCDTHKGSNGSFIPSSDFYQKERYMGLMLGIYTGLYKKFGGDYYLQKMKNEAKISIDTHKNWSFFILGAISGEALVDTYLVTTDKYYLGKAKEAVVQAISDSYDKDRAHEGIIVACAVYKYLAVSETANQEKDLLAKAEQILKECTTSWNRNTNVGWFDWQTGAWKCYNYDKGYTDGYAEWYQTWETSYLLHYKEYIKKLSPVFWAYFEPSIKINLGFLAPRAKKNNGKFGSGATSEVSATSTSYFLMNYGRFDKEYPQESKNINNTGISCETMIKILSDEILKDQSEIGLWKLGGGVNTDLGTGIMLNLELGYTLIKYLNNLIPIQAESASKKNYIKVEKILQNYPNPFNPECYIPYELKDSGNVKVRIYNVLGQKVRELDLGKKAVGSYITKDKATYWDGKDNKGKEVVSGVYYYELVVDNKVVGMKNGLVLK